MLSDDRPIVRSKERIVVTIIDEADALVPNAQDALLKTLEERRRDPFRPRDGQAGRTTDDRVAVLSTTVRTVS